MPYTERFIMIRVRRDVNLHLKQLAKLDVNIQKGVHVGVLDTQRNIVLELVTPDKRSIVIQEIPVNLFGKYIKDEPINPVDDNERILQRWQSVMKRYRQSVNENKKWLYDAGGEYQKNKLNCENLAEWVMTGTLEAPFGKWAAWLKQWFGINVTLGRSGRPGSFDSSSNF